MLLPTIYDILGVLRACACSESRELNEMTMFRAMFVIVAIAPVPVSQPLANAQSSSVSATPAQTQMQSPQQQTHPSSSSPFANAHLELASPRP